MKPLHLIATLLDPRLQTGILSAQEKAGVMLILRRMMSEVEVASATSTNNTHTQLFTDQMLFLSPNELYQSTEDNFFRIRFFLISGHFTAYIIVKIYTIMSKMKVPKISKIAINAASVHSLILVLVLVYQCSVHSFNMF